MRFPFTGVVSVDKPEGVSSRRVVDGVARAVAMRAVGHAGTLDPIASGVVVVCVGHATKLIDFLHTLPKRYVGRFLLGRSSPSDDTELPVELEACPVQPSREAIEQALQAFRGPIMQRPCDYSAVHVDGKRAYALARKGRAVEIADKPVTIHRLELLEYDWPRLVLDVECSTGTYIRAIGRDLAAALGTKAVIDGLIRTAVGPFHKQEAIPLDEILHTSSAAEVPLQPALAAVAHLPAVALNPEQIEHIARGGILDPAVVPPHHLRRDTASSTGTAAITDTASSDAVAATDDRGMLVGMLRPHRAGWRMRPNFLGRS